MGFCSVMVCEYHLFFSRTAARFNVLSIGACQPPAPFTQPTPSCFTDNDCDGYDDDQHPWWAFWRG